MQLQGKSRLTCAPRITEQGDLSNTAAERAKARHQIELIHSHNSCRWTVDTHRSLVRDAGVHHARLKVGSPLGWRCDF